VYFDIARILETGKFASDTTGDDMKFIVFTEALRELSQRDLSATDERIESHREDEDLFSWWDCHTVIHRGCHLFVTGLSCH